MTRTMLGEPTGDQVMQCPPAMISRVDLGATERLKWKNDVILFTFLKVGCSIKTEVDRLKRENIMEKSTRRLF